MYNRASYRVRFPIVRSLRLAKLNIAVFGCRCALLKCRRGDVFILALGIASVLSPSAFSIVADVSTAIEPLAARDV